ncbi:uncharacterized protein [Dermacentor albipictus]|uniref:uncharacterized protein n=1 Tax=Dermacentor albipictus TaxID=60249 RepID=UPI0038FD3C67
MAVGRIGEHRLGPNASWDEYVERLEMFCEANKIAKEEQKRAVLLSFCGEEAYGLIVTRVKPARPTAATYEEIKTVVRKHLHPRPSELYARFLFYKRNQAAEESVADYVTALRKLAEDCGFGDEQLPLDIMMRDHFVCGLQNEAVKQRLLAEHDLAFNVAYNMAATAVATAKQQRDIRMQGRDETKDCQGTIQATRAKQDSTAEGSSCYLCNKPIADGWCRLVLEEQQQCSPELDGMVQRRGIRSSSSPERRRPVSPLYGGQGTKPWWDAEGALPTKVVEISTTCAHGTEPTYAGLLRHHMYWPHPVAIPCVQSIPSK